MRGEKLPPIIRILLLGEPGVGKDCLEARFITSAYPPPYDPSLTLHSRRFFTLSPVLDTTDSPAAPPLPTSHGPEPIDRPEGEHVQDIPSVKLSKFWSSSSTFSIPAFDLQGQDEATRPSTKTPSHENDTPLPASPVQASREDYQHTRTYLIELINYPALQLPQIRAQVHAKGAYDAVKLVYDAGSRASFDAVTALFEEIPTTLRRRPGWLRWGGRKKQGSGTFWTARAASGEREPVAALVGNKSDLAAEWLSLSSRGEAQLTAGTAPDEVPLLWREAAAGETAPKVSSAFNSHHDTPLHANPAGSKTTPTKTGRVSYHEGEMLARRLRLSVPFLETSAKTGENVEEVFEAVIRAVLRGSR